MPVINLSCREVCNLLGKNFEAKELAMFISNIGADIEKIDGDSIAVEIFPDRVDLLSAEGIARALRAFLGIEKGLKEYAALEPEIELYVDSSVAEVRPFAVAAEVLNVELDEELLVALMELQEDLHWAIGRGRKKVAIGLHDASRIKPPYYYRAFPPDAYSFIPLGKSEEMTLAEILEKHEKGIEYGHIIKHHDRYPLIIDAHGNVLSMPPIINGELTRVTPATKKFFIDMTGNDLGTLNKALNIFCTALAERGFTVRKCRIIYDEKHPAKLKELATPDFATEKMKIKKNNINRILGIKLSSKEIIERAEKMGYGVREDNNNRIEFSIPCYRADILHEIDVIEDIAIAHGYGNFPYHLPLVYGNGEKHELSRIEEKARECMLGYGFSEVLTLTLTNEEKNFEKMLSREKAHVRIKNPISEEQTIVRTWLLPSLLEVLEINKRKELPIKIFEAGYALNKSEKSENEYEEELRLCACIMSNKADFAEMKAVFTGVASDLGIEYELEESNNNAFISGRCAGILSRNKEELGIIGEINPEVLENFGIDYPVSAFEIMLTKLR